MCLTDTFLRPYGHVRKHACVHSTVSKMRAASPSAEGPTWEHTHHLTHVCVSSLPTSSKIPSLSLTTTVTCQDLAFLLFPTPVSLLTGWEIWNVPFIFFSFFTSPHPLSLLSMKQIKGPISLKGSTAGHYKGNIQPCTVSELVRVTMSLVACHWLEALAFFFICDSSGPQERSWSLWLYVWGLAEPYRKPLTTEQWNEHAQPLSQDPVCRVLLDLQWMASAPLAHRQDLKSGHSFVPSRYPLPATCT